jgi:hypothetical protein
LFNIDVFAHFDAQRLADQFLERRGVARGGPGLQFRLARRPHLQQRIVSAIVKVHAGDHLRVAPVEALCQAEDGRQDLHGAPRRFRQRGKVVVLPLRRRLPVVACQQGEHVDFLRLEAAQIAVLD